MTGIAVGYRRQRVGVARALYHRPSVLVFDEATSAIDVATEDALNDAIAALHADSTLIVVTHRPESAARCDRQVRLEDGRIID